MIFTKVRTLLVNQLWPELTPVTSLFTVIDQLDILKKDSAGAREAIRWLEADFRKGNW